MAQNLLLNIIAKDKTKQALSGVQASLSRLRSSVFSIQSALLGVGGGLVVRSFVNVGRSVEELGLRFDFLFGSAKEGAKAFDTLVKFAGRVPFSLEEISQASGNLAVVSKDATELGKNLKIVGNVAAVTGLDFRTTAEQIQRSFAGGISAADIFRERGVRALLGFQAGATISTEETIKRFEEVFGENGRFGRATEVLATTFTGTLSMINDKIFQFKLGVNEAGFFDFLKAGLSNINKLIEENEAMIRDFANKTGRSLVSIIKAMILGFGEVFNTVKGVFKIIGTGFAGTIDLIKMLPEGVREFGLLGFLMLGKKGKLAVLILGGIIKKLGIDLEEIAKKFGLVDQVEDFNKELSFTEKFLNDIEASIIKDTQAIAEMKAEISKANAEAQKTKTIFDETANTISENIKKPLKDLTDISKQITNVLNQGIKGFSKGIAESIVLGKELDVTFKSIAQTMAVGILQTVVEIIARESVLLAIEKAKTIYKQQQAMLSATSNLSGLGSLGSFFRASGGSVQKGQPYMVGERGAELFVPNQSGQIQQSARGGSGGGSTTVNFNINTVDASGFEDLLVRSRGTITQLINSAVNERGSKNLI
jgi:hypothetical protein